MATNNHPAQGPVSLERLHQIREHLLHDTQYSNGGNRAYILADVLKVIDGAIAAFGAEPVAWLHSDNGIGIPAITRSRNVADSWFSKGWNLKPLYTTPPATVSFPNEVSWEDVPEEITEDDMELALAWVHGFNQCRAVMLKAGNSPVTQDGYVLVPKKLTAENGAKSVLSGEFSETKFINCPECFGDDDCETCDGSGRIEITVPVTWTTIKAIWAKGVEHFAVAPQQENV
ncbi:hypothetical protein AMA11_00985 [Salmonella enterica subsp. enterica serovar Muenchen]|nr:hypothetical protein [Salmonella enterica subsp. enterica serovar Muenchen]ECD1911604.1 hypothetical protein [Salmonella enterica subsp. enterica serovar Bovismorbificans]ECH8728092.1 hypothetical protein [Salmonella enterica subsp. enterica]EGI6304109.1 hypothetical protein [Salmonella enterica subsp. enterica serovar Hindmarsh]